MNRKFTYVIAGAVLIGVVVWGTWMKPWSTPEVPLEDGSGGEMMQQIEPPTVILQAGSATLGENESETGFMNEDGVKMYNSQPVQQDDDEIIFKMENDAEADSEVVDPSLKIVDEDGDELSDEEKQKLFDESSRE